MTFNPKKLNIALTLSSLLLFASSCKKEQSSTVNIEISGRAFVKTTNAPLANVPVEVNVYPVDASVITCNGCPSVNKVGEGKTGIDGRFSINISLDTNLFKRNYLFINAASDTNYISKTGVSWYNAQLFNKYDENALKNIEFAFYPKTYLTIRLHRTLSDSFDGFTVSHYFDQDWDMRNDYSISSTFYYPKDTSIKFLTTTDMYTKIRWEKYNNGGAAAVKTDSLICPANGTAVFDINY